METEPEAGHAAARLLALNALLESCQPGAGDVIATSVESLLASFRSEAAPGEALPERDQRGR